MARRFALSNGLTVIFEPQHAARVAAFQVWVKAGSADERPDQSGLAHLHEHMLFKGTARRGPGEIAREIEANGGEINAWTSFDQTVYHVVIASPFARAGLDVLGDAVRHPAFDPGELAREIEVVCEEIKRGMDSPGRRASKQLYEASYRVHPYGRQVIGTAESVRSFDRPRVLEFYERHYAPGNIVLTAAGDLDEGRLRDWAEEIFGGDWGRKYAGPWKRPQEPARDGRRIALAEDPAQEAYLHLSFPATPVSHPDTPALDALAMLLGQGDASRLSLEVKRKRALANAISAYAYTPADAGLMTVSITAAPEKAAAALEESMRVMLDLRRTKAPDEELAAVKALIESDAVYGRETVQGQARKLGFYESSGGGIEEEARYYEAIARLTPEAIREVAERYLRPEQVVVAALLPKGTPLDEAGVRALLDRAQETAAPTEARRRLRAGAPPLMKVTSSRAAGPSGVIEERLPSGARVLVREESGVPLFAMCACFRGGTRYERDETSGLTALLARSLARGTRSRSAEEIAVTVDELAGSLGISNGRNTMTLRAEFLSRHFRAGFELFADVLLNPAFAPAEVDLERRLALQEIRSRDDRPSAVVYELFARTLYREHPYRLPLEGDAQVVERLRPEDLRAFHAAHMDPSQLALCVVGDVRADEVLEAAREAFGKARGGAAAAPELPEVVAPGSAEANRALAREQTHLLAGFLGARVTDGWRYPLEVLSTVLSGQGGRLFVELRDRRSLAYSVSSSSLAAIEPGYFSVYMGTSPQKAAGALAGIRAELEKVRQERISPAELDRAIRHLIGSHDIGLQRNGSRAGLLALDHTLGIGQERFLHYEERISAVTADQVLDVARRVIDFGKMVVARVGPP